MRLGLTKKKKGAKVKSRLYCIGCCFFFFFIFETNDHFQNKWNTFRWIRARNLKHISTATFFKTLSHTHVDQNGLEDYLQIYTDEDTPENRTGRRKHTKSIRRRKFLNSKYRFRKHDVIQVRARFEKKKQKKKLNKVPYQRLLKMFTLFGFFVFVCLCFSCSSFTVNSVKVEHKTFFSIHLFTNHVMRVG